MTTKLSKQDVVDRIAEAEDLSKASVARVIDQTFDIIAETMSSGGKVTFVGIGTFEVSQRKARTGRNPQTGKPIQIAAATVPKFKAGKAWKDRVNR